MPAMPCRQCQVTPAVPRLAWLCGISRLLRKLGNEHPCDRLPQQDCIMDCLTDLLKNVFAAAIGGAVAGVVAAAIIGSKYARKRRLAQTVNKLDFRRYPSHESARVNAIMEDPTHEDYALLGELLLESGKAIAAGKWGRCWREVWYWLRYGW